MATNRIRKPGYKLDVAATQPSTPTSGDPVRYGNLTGVALTDEDSDGVSTIDTGPAVWDLYVDDTSGSGIAVGDAVFFDDTPTGSPSTNLNDDQTNGYFFGIALEAVGSNATTLIQVQHVPHGTQVLGTGNVGTAALAANAVTAAKLDATLAQGYIPLDITALREIASNDIQALAAHGGLLASDSDPALARANGATDKALRVVWDTAADTDEVQFPPIGLPPDFDTGSDFTIHLLAAMEGATDTPTIDVQVFNNVGDTEMGGATAAVTGTSLAEYSVTIANANIAALPGVVNVALVPGAHTTDDLYLYAAWIEYARV